MLIQLVVFDNFELILVTSASTTIWQFKYVRESTSGIKY